MTQALGPFAGRGPSLGAGTDAAVQPGVVGSIHAHVREAQENIDTVLAAVLGIQNNVTLSAAVPPVVPRPIAGTRPIEIPAYLYDSAGGMEDPDDLEILVRIRKSDGTFITDRLYQDVLFAVALPNATDVAAFPIASGWRAMLRTGVGLFDMFYKASSTDAEEELLFEFGWEEAAVPVFQSRPLRVTDAADADTVAADVTAILDAIGTLVNTGGTATLGGMLGDPANSSFIVRIAAIKAVVDTLATAAALAAVQADTDALQLDVAAVQADTDDIQSKVGTPVNTGGTATLAAILGDAANSSIVARIIATKAVVDTLATAAALALAQTDIDDIQAKIGTPEAALASLAGQIGIGTEAEGTAGAAAESLHAKLRAILTDTGTTLPTTLGAPAGASVSVDIAAVKAVVGTIVELTSLVGMIGKGDDAVGSDGTPTQSLHSKLRKALADLTTTLADIAAVQATVDAIDADAGPQEADVTWYPVPPTAVLTADPTVEDDAAANTGDSVTFVVLDSYTWTPPETTDAAIRSIFADLRIRASVPVAAGASAVKLAVSPDSSVQTPGAAAGASTVDVTDEIVPTDVLTSYARSGLVPSAGAGDAIPATGGIKLVLLGKVTTIGQGGLTVQTRSSTSLQIAYRRS